jgi:hypothetical protein
LSEKRPRPGQGIDEKAQEYGVGEEIGKPPLGDLAHEGQKSGDGQG